jgi:hypothetical protein
VIAGATGPDVGHVATALVIGALYGLSITL